VSFFKSRNILIVLVITAFAFSSILPGYANTLENQINRSQGELSAIEKDLQSRGKQLEEYQSEEKRIQGELYKLENSLAVLRQEINQLEKDIENTENEIEITENELVEAQKEIELKDELLKRRLRAIYEQGESGYLEVLFNASTFSEFLTRLNDLKIIAENDLKLLEQAYQEKLVIEEKKRKLEEEKVRLLDLKVERMERREELNSQLAEKEILVEKLQENIQATEKAIKELEQEAAKIEQLIKKLQEEMRRQTKHLTPSGKLLWPLAEFGTYWITSGYGYRTDPITRQPGAFHGAIDIGIPRTRWPASPNYNGNPVYIRAAENGIVSYADINGSLSYGYGRLVIIDHGVGADGKGLSTVYAHAHTLLVAPGQEVAKGQNIAIVGSTGSSTGPHLHFEVRVDGVRQNPMNFF
jgi:murein DD-endopeptidase MepM/ murein hydrolase activator NlpD